MQCERRGWEASGPGLRGYRRPMDPVWKRSTREGRDGSFGVRKEAIADAADGLQVLRGGRIFFEVTAQAHDEVVDGAGVGIFAHMPDLIQQFLAGNDTVTVTN